MNSKMLELIKDVLKALALSALGSLLRCYSLIRRHDSRSK